MKAQRTDVALKLYIKGVASEPGKFPEMASIVQTLGFVIDPTAEPPTPSANQIFKALKA